MSNLTCPQCSSNNYIKREKYKTAQVYRCQNCGKSFQDTYLNPRSKPIKKINFDDDIWDLRSLVVNHLKTDRVNLSFVDIKQPWFKYLVKKYVKHCLALEKSVNATAGTVIVFKQLSIYFEANKIEEHNWLNRKIFLDYISSMSIKCSNQTVKNKLVILRSFLETIHFNKWLEVPSGLIKSEDIPKIKPGHSKDIPKIVFDQINNNLNFLPDDVARMWMIGYFCGMRMSELTLCPIDCIHQDSKGQWSITFWRNKVKDYHILPISRELAEVIQQQQKETKDKIDSDYKYLFSGSNDKCFWQYRFSTEINKLIKEKDIRDENGKLWHFTAHQLRDTRATYLFETGHEMAIVSQWLGHKRWTTTQKYVHVKDNTLREETAKVQAQLTSIRGESITWESLPKTLQDNPAAHTIAVPEDHINTPIYGFCGLALDKDCPHWKACYTCRSFVARKELLPDYIKIRDRLRDKQSVAEERGQTALIDQFKQQADSLDVIVHSFGGN